MNTHLIFLDVDGVLNSIGSMVAWQTASRFDPVSVSLVMTLAKEAAAKIVVSSAWRCSDVPRTKQSLARGLAGDHSLLDLIIGVTPDLCGEAREPFDKRRGHEIQKWRDDNGHVGRYVILDDCADMLPGQPLVQTDVADGFRLREYRAALEILNPEHEAVKSLRSYTDRKRAA